MVKKVYRSINRGLKEAIRFENGVGFARTSRINLVENEDADEWITVTCTCPACFKDYYLDVKEDDYDTFLYNDRWNRPLIQDLFPYLSNDWRELLMGGVCPDCWDKMFGTDEE